MNMNEKTSKTELIDQIIDEWMCLPSNMSVTDSVDWLRSSLEKVSEFNNPETT